jgi:AcrR family transcriptional regulator
MISRQDEGRTNQKARTRRAVIDAAADIVRDGRTPTVAEAAERALVSRATAYRYFPSQQSLLIEVRVDASRPPIDELLAEVGDDLAARVDTIARALARIVLADEALYRNQIRAIQDIWFSRDGDHAVPVREGRRLAWIDQALAPNAANLSKQKLHRLRNGLAAVIGVDTILSLRDICALNPPEIEECLAWTAGAVVQAALTA